MQNILVVDDEAGIVDICERSLTRKGYKVYAASNGEDALKILEREAVDLALVDLRMPQFDGNELLKKIKKSFPLTEVIIVTAESTLEVAIDCLENGAFDYILKPFNISELLTSVKRALEYSNLRRKENVFAEITKLCQIAHEIDKTRSINDLLKLIFDCALRIVDAESGMVFLSDQGTKTMKPVFPPDSTLDELQGIKLGEMLLKMFSAKCESVLTGDEQSEPGGLNIKEFYPQAVSAMIVPFAKHGSIIGYLLLIRFGNSSLPKFSTTDLESVNIFSTHASMLISLQHQYPLTKQD